MPAKKRSPRYVAPVGGNYTDPSLAGEIRFEAGDEISEFAAGLFGWPPAPEPEVSPAAAGSSQPGDDDGSAQ